MSKQELYCIVCGPTDWSVVKHSFPTCPERRAKWLSILGVDPKAAKSRAKVCEKHFSKDQYIRTKLNSNAVPNPPTGKLYQAKGSAAKRGSGTPVVTRHPRIESKTGNVWQDKINLNGRCVFCLEMVSNSKSTPPPSDLSAKWTSLEHLWPYLQANGPPTKSNFQDFYLGKRDNDGELIFSQIPPMCPSCLRNVDTLNTLHHQLEALRAKLIQQEKLVKAAAERICETVVLSVKPRRNILQKELAEARIPIPCVLNTTHFLDSLLGNPLREYESTKVLPTPIAPQAMPPPMNPQVIVLRPVSGLLTNCTSNLGVLNKVPIPAKPKPYTPNVASSPKPAIVKVESQDSLEANEVIEADCVDVKMEPIENEEVSQELSGESSEDTTTIAPGEIPIRGTTKSIRNRTIIGPRSSKRRKTRDFGDNCSDESYKVKNLSSLSDDEELIDNPASQDSNYIADDNDVDESFDDHDPLADT